MDSCGNSFPAIHILFLMFAISFTNCWAEDPLYWVCSDNGNYTKGSQTEKNVQAVIRNLVNRSFHAAAYNTSAVGNNSDAIYGLLQCRGDTSASQCKQCAQDAASAIPARCGTALGGRAWFDYCYFRFDSTNFFGVNDFEERKYLPEGVEFSSDEVAVLGDTVHQLLGILNTRAVQPSSSRFAYGVNGSTGVAVSVYGFVQCWGDLSVGDCRNCLESVRSEIYANYLRRQECQILSSSCFNRYEIYSFFNASASPQNFFNATVLTAPTSQLPAPTSSFPESKSKKSGGMLPAILGATGGGFLLLCGLFVACRRKQISQRFQPAEHPQKDDDLVDEDEFTMFSMETLMAATNNFDESLKLGEGGFGAVYKGTLHDGKEVAVKKLYMHSIRGKQEFLNEINALARIQHRNLINLLGCCIEGSYRILVYEFLPNTSLDKFLFDQQKAKLLDWETRYNIIIGISRALVYLHQDSKIKIIHRDIKAGNILLDDRFNPKVADFGLAKLFKEDESHVQTKVAGTYGYMAPEYAMRCQLSTKADVYSFGVLILEIMSGKKNSDYDPAMNPPSLVGWAWRLHQEHHTSMMLDEAIKSTYVIEQVIRCIHVALLCTQEDPFLRPTMSTVVLMLSSASVTLPNPANPAYVCITRNNGVTTTIPGNQAHESLGTDKSSNATISTSALEPR